MLMLITSLRILFFFYVSVFFSLLYVRTNVFTSKEKFFVIEEWKGDLLDSDSIDKKSGTQISPRDDETPSATG